jgi:hypothetical protein
MERVTVEPKRRWPMRLKLTLAIPLICGLAMASPALHKFSLWGLGTTKNERAFLYWGWTNGFLQARGAYSFGLAACLEEMSTEQALGMVDKYYKDHPEKWSEPFAEQILEALTVDGGPCKGKNPLAKLTPIKPS